jgi:hypothetical protein
VVSEIIKCAESEYTIANEPAVEGGGGSKISFRRDSGMVFGGSMPPEAVAQVMKKSPNPKFNPKIC